VAGRELCWFPLGRVRLLIKEGDLMLKAVARHTDQKWILLYVERWLKAPMQKADGALVRRTKGTPHRPPLS
jgi:RNA-directed DNA polymerase